MAEMKKKLVVVTVLVLEVDGMMVKLESHNGKIDWIHRSLIQDMDMLKVGYVHDISISRELALAKGLY